jgi:hypothetical protein
MGFPDVLPCPFSNTSAAARIFRSEEELAELPASERIRYRLVAADCRYHANDNIAEHVATARSTELKAEVQAKMQEVLQSLVIDTESDHNTRRPPSAWPRCSWARCSAAATTRCPR